MFLLSEFEVFGMQMKAQIYEQNRQMQYAYYADPNTSKVKYNNTPTSWWLRSNDAASATTIYSYCVVSADGSVSTGSPELFAGLSPAFVLG